MRFRFLVMAAALACAAPSAAHNRPLEQDELDPALLRVEEGLYLNQKVPDVAIVTRSGTRRLSELIAEQPTILALAYYNHWVPAPLALPNSN